MKKILFTIFILLKNLIIFEIVDIVIVKNIKKFNFLNLGFEIFIIKYIIFG